MTNLACTLCKAPLGSKVERNRQVCDACAAKTGIVVLQPSRRKPHPCTRCGHDRFVRAIPRELAERDGRPTAGPMFAAYQIPSAPTFAGLATVIESIDARRGFGVFEVYICKACGFCEWYCLDPEEIPIGPEYMTEDVGSDGTPYR